MKKNKTSLHLWLSQRQFAPYFWILRGVRDVELAKKKYFLKDLRYRDFL